jgi:elongation factor Ts
MDCKSISWSWWDFELNRKPKRTKVAANRSDRESTEGAALLLKRWENCCSNHLNCDFVGMNESFVTIQKANLHWTTYSKEAFLAAEYKGITVAEKLIEQTGVIGEKLEIRTLRN